MCYNSNQYERGIGIVYTEEYRHNGFFFRKFILKILLIITVIFLVVWLLPKLISYKPSNSKQKSIQITEENTQDRTVSDHLSKLKVAALTYYKEDKLPKENQDIALVTLKELQKEQLISELVDSNNQVCDGKKTYAKLTKLEDDYLLKLFVKCGKKKDYSLIHVGKYSYCTNSICEKDHTKDDIKEEKMEEEPVLVNSEQKEDVIEKVDSSLSTNNMAQVKLSNFSNWSEYIKTSCNTTEVSCNVSDFSCLTEIRMKKQTEKVGTYTKNYHTYSLDLNKKAIIKTKACSNYNYVIIQGSIYRTLGNYEEILSLNRTSTANWTYKGTISTATTPNFGANKYYKYVGADFKNCQETCSSTPAYYYDVYEYNKAITKVSTTTENCNNIVQKNINVYQIIKKLETAKREEPLYATACYQSTRVRKKVN